MSKKAERQKTAGEGKIPFLFSIRFRILAAFLVPIICIVILGVASYNKASGAISEAYKQQTQQTAEILGQYVSLITDTEKQELKAYLAEQDLQQMFKGILDKTAAISAKTTYKSELGDKLARDEQLSNIYILSDDGNSLMAKTATIVDDAYTQFGTTSEGQLVADAPYDWHLVGIDSDLDEVTGMNDSYAIRWVRKFKDMPQVMIVDFDASKIRDSLSILDAGADGYVALITSDGKEFYSSETVTETGLFYGQSFYEKALSAEEMSGNSIVTANGTRYLFVYSKMDGNDAMVAALIPEADVLSQTSDIKQLTMIITIVAAAVAVLLALLIAGQIAGTTKYILRKLGKVAEGDLTTHLTPKGRDELAMLCLGVNETVENVKDLISGVNAVSEEVSEAAGNVADASDTFRSTSGEIRKAVDRIESGAGRLDTNSADCLGQMDSLSTQITEVGNNAGQIGRLTGQTGDTISEGIKSVDGLTQSAQATTRITEDVIVAINELEKRSKAINEIVVSINSIAKQTNLLSLNAGIEAARAGEAGRGFTVVATEIRELSNQCMNSANQISEIVEEISEKTAQVVSIAEQASGVVSTQAAAVEKTKESFTRINAQVTELIDALGIITDNVNVMNDSRSETLHSIESISEISAETVACSGEVNTATGTQVEAIDNLDAASDHLKVKAGELLEMLTRFKVE